jgi:mono/diheme cytochrome c family protein
VLPSQYDTLTQLTVPFVIMTALGQAVFAYNLIQTVRGRTLPERETVLKSLGLTASLVAAAGVLALTAVLFNRDNAGETPSKPELGATTAGQDTFVSTCGSCHTLKAAGTTGRVGPDLDALKPDKARVLAAINNGGTGSGTMPKGLVTGAEAGAVAKYVSESAGK